MTAQEFRSKLFGIIYDKWPLILTILVCIGIVIYAYGCEPKTKSLTTPNAKVTRDELQLELNSLISTAQIRLADLDRQQEIRDIIFQNALVIAQGGGVNPVGVITAILAIMGVGATADDIRLRKERSKNLTNYVALAKSKADNV